jgi:hypothetical protein
MKQKFFYAVEFWDRNRDCTTGQPNEKTGRMSIACDLMAFSSREERYLWVRKDIQYRSYVTKNEMRKLCRGMSIAEYNEYIESLQQEAAL